MITASFLHERLLWEKGFQFICGIDEVGRGCFAGPVVAGAVVFPANIKLPFEVADSKLLTAKTRDRLSEGIKKIALAWSVGEISCEAINKFGIVQATQMAYRKAIKLLTLVPDFLLIDAFYVKNEPKETQLPIIKGDQISASIASASIIAKVYRDNLMVNLASRFPNYGFERNKGYGTLDHRQAIKQNGLSKMHRISFDLSKYT